MISDLILVPLGLQTWRKGLRRCKQDVLQMQGERDVTVFREHESCLVENDVEVQICQPAEYEVAVCSGDQNNQQPSGLYQE